MRAEPKRAKLGVEMYARAVDDAGSRLRELRHEEWSEFGLGALAIGFALLATQTKPEFAIPLFVGGLVVAVRGAIAAWRRWEIIDGLAAEPDAYVIAEVREHALAEATIDRRRLYAAYIRYVLRTSGAGAFGVATRELEALVSELEDPNLTLDPACGVACARLVSDPAGSPLSRAGGLSPEELRFRVRRIRSGLAPRSGA